MLRGELPRSRRQWEFIARRFDGDVVARTVERNRPPVFRNVFPKNWGVSSERPTVGQAHSNFLKNPPAGYASRATARTAGMGGFLGATDGDVVAVTWKETDPGVSGTCPGTGSFLGAPDRGTGTR